MRRTARARRILTVRTPKVKDKEKRKYTAKYKAAAYRFTYHGLTTETIKAETIKGMTKPKLIKTLLNTVRHVDRMFSHKGSEIENLMTQISTLKSLTSKTDILNEAIKLIEDADNGNLWNNLNTVDLENDRAGVKALNVGYTKSGLIRKRLVRNEPLGIDPEMTDRWSKTFTRAVKYNAEKASVLFFRKAIHMESSGADLEIIKNKGEIWIYGIPEYLINDFLNIVQQYTSRDLEEELFEVKQLDEASSHNRLFYKVKLSEYGKKMFERAYSPRYEDYYKQPWEDAYAYKKRFSKPRIK